MKNYLERIEVNMREDIFRIIKLGTMSFLLLGIIACSYEEPVTPPVEEESEAAVQIELSGSTIEGLTVCLDSNNTCKQTNSKGVVEFTTFGVYRFMIRDMNLTKLTIDANRTVVSPYVMFDSNDTLAQRYLMLVHAFSKSTDPTDDSVLLSLSDYIPTDKSIELLLAKTNNGVLSYSINDHNVSLTFADNNISRDGTDFNLSLPSKVGYSKLNLVKDFVDLAVDKNVSFDNFEEKFLLTKTSLLSFNLGSKYTVTVKPKGDDVEVSFLDNESRTTDKATLIDTNTTEVLTTNLSSLRIR